MSDKNYTPANGEAYLVRRTGEKKSLVKRLSEKTGSEFQYTLEKSAIDDKTTRIAYSSSETERKALWIYQTKSKRILAWPGGSIELDAAEYSENSGNSGGSLKPLKLTMPGKVLSVKVKEGDIVEIGHSLVVVEAMKMENLLLASARARILKVHVQAGDRLESGALLLSFEAAE